MRLLYSLVALEALVEASHPALLVARQAVTIATSPTAQPPAGCTASASFAFGLAVRNVSTQAVGKRGVIQMISEQVTNTSMAVEVVTDQYHSGQVQIPATNAAAETTPAPSPLATMGLITQISDGQIQAQLHTVIMMPVAREISDGQIQVPTTVAPVTEYSNGEPQAPTIAPQTLQTVAAVSELTDGQIIMQSSAESNVLPATTLASATSVAPSEKTQNAVCAGGFSVTMADNRLTDAAGRTGYIASNYQLQFDQPPQAGAIYTSGFSICGNGSLALGGSNIFYQCLSGDFYNLYDRHWARQCSPITIETMREVNC